MARTADHEARRAQIIASVKTLTLDVGLGHVTIARVAKAADISVGLVQHYYATKDELLLDTFRSVRHDVLQRIDAAIARAERRHERIERMLLDALEQFLPLSRKRVNEVRLMQSFAGLALETPALQQGFKEAVAEHLDRVEAALRNGQACGEVEPTIDSSAEAYPLLALTNGLAVQMLIVSGRPQQTWARQALAREVARLFPGDCRHHADA